ncbi:MAG TPA: hypothetical protein EYH14_01050 [Euryarchaeota archaeon]|nr:hypothetical protein [Euryarchaeota archaeon]
MEKAVVILIALVVGLTVLGYPWLAVILAFGGALAIAAMPATRSTPDRPPERKWEDVPVPEAGEYPGWDFWVKHVEKATETAMDALRLGTGIQYLSDEIGDFWKKKVWDADVPIMWVMTPWGPMSVNKKANLAVLYQLITEAYAVQARIANAKDPEEVKELQKKLLEIRKRIENAYLGKYEANKDKIE